MDILYENRKNCYDVNNGEEEYVRQWADNQTTNITIEVQSFPFIPYLFYTQHNSTDYQWCGPMLLLVEAFAKLTRTRIKLSPLKSVRQLIAGGPAALPPIALMPFIASHYYRFVILRGKSHFRRISTVLNYAVPDRVLAKTIKDDNALLEAFRCFEPEVYYSMFASIVFISCFMGLIDKSLNTVFKSFWSHLSVILSDSYSMKINKRSDRIVSGSWLLVCTVLLSAFSGQLRELLIKPKPIQWIDSWKDLSQWKHITKIQTQPLSNFINYVKVYKDSDPMAKDLSGRVEQPLEVKQKYYTNGSYNSKLSLDFDGLMAGKVALVYPTHYLQIYKNVLISKNLEEDIDFHISESGDSPQPVFTETNRLTLNKSLAIQWDFVINVMRESAIYDYLFKVGLNPRRIGPDTGEIVDPRSFVFDSISLIHMRGVLILLIIFEVFCLFVFLLEITKSMYF